MSVLTVPEIIQIAEISQYKALISKKSGKVYDGGNFDLVRLLYMVRKNVSRKYDQDPTDESLIATSKYLLSLCAPYRGIAQQIAQAGGGGTVVPVTPGAPPTQLNFTVAASGTTLIDGQSSVTLSAFIGFNLLVNKNGTPLTQITSAPVYYTWGITTGLLTVSPAAFLGDEFQITAV